MTPEQTAHNAALDHLDTLGPRACLFCDGEKAYAIHDTDSSRAYQCGHCLAVEWITKSKTSWWYHGAQQLDTDETPGLRIDGDGKQFAAPIPFARWQDLATEGTGAPFSQV